MQELDARLCLAGHGRTFTDVQAHIDANRTLVRRRLAKVQEVLAVVTVRAIGLKMRERVLIGGVEVELR